MNEYAKLFVSSVRESIFFTIACVGVALVWPFFLGTPLLDGLGLVLLVAGAGLMLIGGAMGFVSPGNVKVVNALFRSKLKPTADDYRKTRNRAALYSATGILLFAYSLVLAIIVA